MSPDTPPPHHFSVVACDDPAQQRLVVTGELDIASIVELREALDQRLASAAADRVLLDLQAVTFVDSSGLAVLVEYARRAGTDGTRLQIATSEAVDRIVELAGLTSVLPLVPQ